MKRALLLLVCLFTFPAMAQDKDNIGMVTGPRTGTYIALGSDIAKVAQKEGLRISVKESTGSIDNIKRISSDENAALGIVQSDVLGFLSRSKNPESVKIAKGLRMVFPFNREEVHLLARKEVRNFSDLAGKRVVVGSEGSGSMLTSVNLFAMMGVRPAQMLQLSPPEGLASVLKNEADAIIFVGGKPVKLFKNMEELAASAEGKALVDSVHFVGLNDPKMLAEYAPAQITAADYNFINGAVPTIAVTAVLVSYDFSTQTNSYHKARCDMLGKLAGTIRDHIQDLKENGHPKWQEVHLDTDIAYWKKDACAHRDLGSNMDTKSLGLDLIGVVTEQK